MTLNSVVLPAPLGPIRPVISPSRADRVTSVRALTPPKRTAMPETRRTARSSAASVAIATSAAGVDKARLLFHEHGSRAGGLRQYVGERGLARAQPLGHARDPTTDAV